MDALGLLNPAPNQAAATGQLSAQSTQQAQDLANLLRKEGQTQGKFTSPWQVAGQWAQALRGKQMQDQLNPQYTQLQGQQPYGAPDAAAAPPPAGTPAAPATDAMPWSKKTSDNEQPDMSFAGDLYEST